MAMSPRPPKAPVVLDSVVDDPERIRRMARDHGPYWQPGRTIASSKSVTEVNDNTGDDADTDFADAMIGPTFRGQWAFGEPLVENPADFGLRTPRPVHHGLLDYLAAFLVENGWRTNPPSSMVRADAR